MQILHRHSANIFLLSLAIFVVAILFTFLVKAPSNSITHLMITVEKGRTVSSVAKQLKAGSVVRSEFLLKGFLIVFGGNGGMKAGDYFFEYPQNAIKVAYRLANGLYGVESVRVTIPEGSNVFEIAKIATPKLYKFNPNQFVAIASSSEGYLFPDTYHFLSSSDETEVFNAMKKRFNEKIKEVEDGVKDSGRPLDEVIKMSSILEEEARKEMTRKMIAGILWKRFDEGMPLQVDAAFIYVNGKNTFELTTEDLRADHPYNTYTRKGFPPTPITNPGLDSILAALTPIESPYYYYLSDLEGEMHYAVTHDEHVENKFKYLK